MPRRFRVNRWFRLTEPYSQDRQILLKIYRLHDTCVSIIQWS